MYDGRLVRKEINKWAENKEKLKMRFRSSFKHPCKKLLLWKVKGKFSQREKFNHKVLVSFNIVFFPNSSLSTTEAAVR